jgi:hypothetical protein
MALQHASLQSRMLACIAGAQRERRRFLGAAFADARWTAADLAEPIVHKQYAGAVVLGSVVVLSAGTLAFNGNHPDAPAISTPAGCQEACGNLPWCNVSAAATRGTLVVGLMWAGGLEAGLNPA